MKRLATLALVAIAAAGACSSGGKKSSSTTTTVPTDWSASGLKVADGLVAKLTAAKKACTAYTHWDYPLLSAEYKKGLPLPDAVAACTGPASEDFTFEVFADPAAKAKYVEAKRKLLCAAADRTKIDYPGFPYVDGGTWIFEPDEPATATALATTLGGTVKQAGCKT